MRDMGCESAAIRHNSLPLWTSTAYTLPRTSPNAAYRRGTRSDRSDSGSTSDSCLCLKRPINAAAGRIDRIHVAAVGAHEDPSAEQRRLGIHGHCRWTAECPLELEFGHVARCQTRCLAILKACIRRTGAPTCPRSSTVGPNGRRAGAAVRHLFRLAAPARSQPPAGHIFSNTFLLSIGQVLSHLPHGPCCKGGINPLWGHLMDGRRIRGAVDGRGTVTLQAIVAEKSSAVAFTVLVVRTRRVPQDARESALVEVLPVVVRGQGETLRTWPRRWVRCCCWWWRP